MLTKKSVLSIIVILSMCAVMLSGCGKKSDVDKLIGTWKIDDMGANSIFGDYVIEFYEPDEKDGNSGSLGYINRHDAHRRGEYSYHESSKTLELALYDEFNVPNDWTDYLTATVEFEDDNCIWLESEKWTLKLTRYED